MYGVAQSESRQKELGIRTLYTHLRSINLAVFPKYWCRTTLVGSAVSWDFPESVNDCCQVGNYLKN